MVLVQVHECLTTHKECAKSVSQGKSTGPLLQRHSLKEFRYEKELCFRYPLFTHVMSFDCIPNYAADYPKPSKSEIVHFILSYAPIYRVQINFC